MKRTPLARKTALTAKTGFKRPARGQKLPQARRKTTKASKLRRKRGEWSTATADSHFSRYIRERDGKCLRCQTTEGLTCSHYHGRGKSATRFDPANCIALCWKCHQEWEGPKSEYTQFMLERLGMIGLLELTLKAGTMVKRSDAVRECKLLLSL